VHALVRILVGNILFRSVADEGSAALQACNLFFIAAPLPARLSACSFFQLKSKVGNMFV
jgi:hypothetical protein